MIAQNFFSNYPPEQDLEAHDAGPPATHICTRRALNRLRTARTAQRVRPFVSQCRIGLRFSDLREGDSPHNAESFRSAPYPQRRLGHETR